VDCNGTAAGTSELTGIIGASSDGVAPDDITVFASEVMFSGRDTSPSIGLWISNGTAAGTFELTGIGGTDASGSIPATSRFSAARCCSTATMRPEIETCG
jgi:hypothetical protein